MSLGLLLLGVFTEDIRENDNSAHLFGWDGVG
jgi:hypothetical protein